MDKEVGIPSVRVIEDGKPTTRIDPNVAQFIAQMATVGQLVRMRRLEESKVPVGAPSYVWIITTVMQEIVLGNPWIGFTLINGGPNDIRMRINTLEGDIAREATVNNGETITRDFKYPIITKLYLVTTAGVARARVWAEEGRKCQ